MADIKLLFDLKYFTRTAFSGKVVELEPTASTPAIYNDSIIVSDNQKQTTDSNGICYFDIVPGCYTVKANGKKITPWLITVTPDLSGTVNVKDVMSVTPTYMGITAYTTEVSDARYYKKTDVVTSSLNATSSSFASTASYALNAGSAGISSQWVTSGSNIYYNSGSVSIGTDATQSYAKLYVNGNISGNSVYGSAFGSTGAGVSFLASGVTKMYLDPSGNLAINSGSAPAKLYVKGSTSDSTANSLQVDNSSNTELFKIDNLGNTAFGTNKLFISSSGKIGIGTTTPSQTFNVVGISHLQGPVFFSAATGAYSQLVGDASGNCNILTTGYYDFQTYLGGGVSYNSKMRLTNSGSLGIGTTTPIGKLHVVKDETQTSFDDFGDSQLVLANSDTGRLLLGFINDTNYGVIQTLKYGSSWTTHSLALQPKGGKVGIGTNDPKFKFQTKLSTDNNIAYRLLTDGSGTHPDIFGINDAGNTYSILSINASTLLLNNDSQGKIGIGLTNPTAKLHVKGSTSDSTSNALLIQNSSNVELLKVRNDGLTTINNLTSSLIRVGGSTSTTEKISIKTDSTFGENIWSGSYITADTTYVLDNQISGGLMSGDLMNGFTTEATGAFAVTINSYLDDYTKYKFNFTVSNCQGFGTVVSAGGNSLSVNNDGEYTLDIDSQQFMGNNSIGISVSCLDGYSISGMTLYKYHEYKSTIKVVDQDNNSKFELNGGQIKLDNILLKNTTDGLYYKLSISGTPGSVVLDIAQSPTP